MDRNEDEILRPEIGEVLLPVQKARAALKEYGESDPEVPPGQLPPEQTGQWLEVFGKEVLTELAPQEQREAGWLYFEHAIGLLRADSRNKKAANVSLAQARGCFGTVWQDMALPVSARTHAFMDTVSLAIYEDILLERLLVNPQSRNKLSRNMYMLALNVGRHLGEADETTAHTASLLALTNYKFGKEDLACYLPALPRQGWHVNVYDSPRSRAKRIWIGDEPSVEGCLAISPNLIQTTWPGEDFGRYPTLNAYVELRSNYEQYGGNKTTDSGARAFYERAMELRPQLAATRQNLAEYISEFKPAPPKVEVPEVPVMREMIPEALRYFELPVGDARHLPEAELLSTMQMLEKIADTGEIIPAELHALAWMRLDYAQIMAMQEAPAEVINAQCEAALQSIIAAAEAYQQAGQQAGRFEALIDLESFPVYQAVITNMPEGPLRACVDRADAKLVALYSELKKEYAKVDATQKQAIGRCLSRMTLLLLFNTEPDRGFLALAGAPRAGGEGRQDALVLPINGEGTYEADMGVYIRLEDGSEVAHKEGYVTVGANIFVLKGDAVMLNKLSDVVKDRKTRKPKVKAAGKKSPKGKSQAIPQQIAKKSRGEAIETVAGTITDAVYAATPED